MQRWSLCAGLHIAEEKRVLGMQGDRRGCAQSGVWSWKWDSRSSEGGRRTTDDMRSSVCWMESIAVAARRRKLAGSLPTLLPTVDVMSGCPGPRIARSAIPHVEGPSARCLM